MKQDLNGVRTPEDVMRRLADNVKITSDEVNGLTVEVSKKVGNDEIVSKINQSPEQIAISADKIKLEGYTTINGGFVIDKNGNMICNAAKVNGEIESSKGIIGGWQINPEGLTNSVVRINNDGSSTIYTVADLIIIRNFLMGVAGFELSTAMQQHYDIDGDGQLTALDYVTLQNLIGISMNN